MEIIKKWVVEDWKFELAAIDGKGMPCGNLPQSDARTVYMV